MAIRRSTSIPARSFCVRPRPSDEDKSYPMDIAVFKDPMKIEDGPRILIIGQGLAGTALA